MKALLDMLMQLNMYNDLFEVRFVQETQDYYHNEARSVPLENNISSYLRHIERRLKEECDRVDHYLITSTKRHLVETVETEFISVRADEIVWQAPSLLAEGNIEDLSLLYSLFSRVTLLDKVRKVFFDYMKVCS